MSACQGLSPDKLTPLKAGSPLPEVPQSGLLSEMAKVVVEMVFAMARGEMHFENGSRSINRVLLEKFRGKVRRELGGEAALADVCAVIGMFNGITKVADMCGVRLDEPLEQARGSR